MIAFVLAGCPAPPPHHPADPVDPTETASTGDTAVAPVPSCPGLVGTVVCYQSDAQPCPQLLIPFFRGGKAQVQVYDQDCLLSSRDKVRWACTGVDEVTVDGEIDAWDADRQVLTTVSWGELAADQCAPPSYP